MSILHVESFEDCGNEGLLPKTDADMVFLTVDINDKELACQAKTGDLVQFQEPAHNFHRSCGSICSVHQ